VPGASGARRWRLRRTADRLVAALPDAELVILREVDHFGAPRDFPCISRSLEFIDAAPF